MAKRWSQKILRFVREDELVERVAVVPDMEVTSAPAEKKRPAPMRTVMVVDGWVLSVWRAEMVSSIMEPPKELRDWGRLNW